MERIKGANGELMKYSMQPMDGKGHLTLYRYDQLAVGGADNAHLEFWIEIEELRKQLADAQAAIAALQARVQELEARQHFGACAKCLTNAWRICKEGTPDAVEMKCSNGSTWWLCDYCLSKEQLAQRTAELAAARTALNALRDGYDDLESRHSDAQAELERVSLLSSHNERRFEEVDKKYKELRTLILTLPKVGVVTGDTVVNIVQQYNFHQWMLRALQHRQEMEG